MEEIYKSILESIPYPIVFVNLYHEVIYINKRADEIYHKERKYPNIVGQSIFHCHNDDSPEKRCLPCCRWSEGWYDWVSLTALQRSAGRQVHVSGKRKASAIWPL